ncbi:subtilisin-like protein [Anaeromyces robustus]|uniref:Subtilisin-like protein n=1 Tax=Anaeromyces robustus TaxID=1754192 RepID=A0A1Y1XCV8_9FUNG|nr:subtilisin-like protein [Anaeromyces robustus]|eukprot:ORX83214.1 subtilisin-like protein [Anaeromyces robustus]
MDINIKKKNKIDTQTSNNNSHHLNDNEDISVQDDDNFYLIFVNYTSIANETDSEKIHNKRHEENREEFIDSVMDEIHDLILDNLDTYEKPEAVEELLNKEKLRKRDDQYYFGTVNKISSFKEITVLTAILSSNLTDSVKNINGVYGCIPNQRFQYHRFNKQDIIDETRWKKIAMRKTKDVHLSLISQGKYNPDLISKYDNTYYYPEHGGNNTKIVIFDDSFNFKHKEFYNPNRYAGCLIGWGGDGQPRKIYDDQDCLVGYSEIPNHGRITADLAAGLEHGVAPNADIYGIPIENTPTFIAIIRALDNMYYYSNMLYDGNNRVVFNFSFGGYFNKKKEFVQFFDYLENFISHLTNYGIIFVASAGNNYSNVYNATTDKEMLPCLFEKVICVGATDNPYNTTSNDPNKILTNSYRKANFSNFGDGVNIYAPGYHNYAITNFKDNTNEEGLFAGTSGAAPIVAGVVATIMSEHPKITFNFDSMLTYLQKISIKNAIVNIEKDHPSNYFINNGKHVVYSEDDFYYGCGINAGYNRCGRNLCCTFNGYCVNDENSCKIENGCQFNYGICKFN